MQGLDASVGHKLFSVMLAEPALGPKRRVFTSDPVDYPLGGHKPMPEDDYHRQIFQDGQPFHCPDAAAIRAHFRDADLILSLGVASVLNVPVRFDGRVLGALNLLHDAHHYDTARIARVQGCAAFAIPLLLAEGGLRAPPG
jgi:GAF domain-containing protein